jgi:hypothetical protein
MKSALLALLRDESSQDSAEYALVVALFGVGVVFLSRLSSNRGRATFLAFVPAPQASLSGIVDALQEVSEQRKAVLCKLRMALVSGKDDEALEMARELCGLRIRREKSH